MPSQQWNNLQSGSDIIVNHGSQLVERDYTNGSLKSGQKTKQNKTKNPKRKTTRQPIIHPIVCFHPFLDPFIHQLGWGEGYLTVSSYDSRVYNLEWMPKTCELRLLERNKTKQNKSQTTRNSETSKQENNSPYLVYNILNSTGFCFSKYTFLDTILS